MVFRQLFENHSNKVNCEDGNLKNMYIGIQNLAEMPLLSTNRIAEGSQAEELETDANLVQITEF